MQLYKRIMRDISNKKREEEEKRKKRAKEEERKRRKFLNDERKAMKLLNSFHVNDYGKKWSTKHKRRLGQAKKKAEKAEYETLLENLQKQWRVSDPKVNMGQDEKKKKKRRPQTIEEKIGEVRQKNKMVTFAR